MYKPIINNKFIPKNAIEQLLVSIALKFKKTH